MSDKLEQAMKKIHIYLANCKESAYSSEDLIVSKKRIFSLLEELNYAVYDAMEEYEVTVAARDRGIAQAERLAADIKHEAMNRADEIHASSLLYTQEAISDLKSAMEYMHEKVRVEYEMMLMNYEERLHYLEQDSMEVLSQLQSKADARIYLHMIEDIKAKRKTLPEDIEPEFNSRNVGSAASSDSDEVPVDAFESKLASAIVVEVHDTPKIPEGFGKGRRKKKGKNIGGGEVAVTAQELDAEYFAFQEEQQKALEAQLAADVEADLENEKEESGSESIFGALKRFGFGNKKK